MYKNSFKTSFLSFATLSIFFLSFDTQAMKNGEEDETPPHVRTYNNSATLPGVIPYVSSFLDLADIVRLLEINVACKLATQHTNPNPVQGKPVVLRLTHPLMFRILESKFPWNDNPVEVRFNQPNQDPEDVAVEVVEDNTVALLKWIHGLTTRRSPLVLNFNYLSHEFKDESSFKRRDTVLTTFFTILSGKKPLLKKWDSLTLCNFVTSTENVMDDTHIGLPMLKEGLPTLLQNVTQLTLCDFTWRLPGTLSTLKELSIVSKRPEIYYNSTEVYDQYAAQENLLSLTLDGVHIRRLPAANYLMEQSQLVSSLKALVLKDVHFSDEPFTSRIKDPAARGRGHSRGELKAFLDVIAGEQPTLEEFSILGGTWFENEEDRFDVTCNFKRDLSHLKKLQLDW